MSDVIVEQVRRVREELVNRYGGIDGYFRHCQAQERAPASQASRRKRPPAARKTRKVSKCGTRQA